MLTAADFHWVFAQAEFKISDRHFLLLARTSQITNSPPSRLGLVVAKKHAKLAVQRNFIKRAIRESFRLFTAQHAFPQGLDIVVLTRPGVAEADTRRLRSILNSHWRRLAKKQQDALSKQP